MTTGDRSMRASDADRECVAASLRDHFTAGRLTKDEFDERLGKAYAATTLGDLADLQADLPVAPSQPQFPVPTPTPGPVLAGPGRLPDRWRGAVGSWLSISLVCFVIWLLGGADSSLWFLWPTGVLGAIMIGRLVSGAGPDDRRQNRRDYRRQRRGW